MHSENNNRKRLIIKTAAGLFLQNGFKATTLEMISREAGAPLNDSLKKSELLSCMLEVCSRSIFRIMEKNHAALISPPVCRQVLFSKLLFAAVLSDNKKTQLYRELYEDGLLDDWERRICEDFISESGYESAEEAQYCIKAQLGAKRELLLGRIDKLHLQLDDSLISFASTIAARLAGEYADKIDEAVIRAGSIIKELDTGKVCFFTFE